MAGPLSYNDTPQALQQASASQPLIQTNFQSINTLIGTDHESFSSSNAGFHHAIHIVAGALSPSLIAGQCGFFVSSNDLFVQKGTNTAINITGGTLSTTGSTAIPSGLIQKWGRVTTNGSGLATVTFATPFTTIFIAGAFISKIGGSANPNSNDRIAQTYDYTNTTMSIVTYLPDTARNRTAADVVWFALGI